MDLFFVLILIAAAVLGLFLLRAVFYKSGPKTAFVVVLGDLGRSPRMNYHCLSLTNLGYKIKFIGYAGIFLYNPFVLV
jgi:beta-1,4-mannosyltransferase